MVMGCYISKETNKNSVLLIIKGTSKPMICYKRSLCTGSGTLISLEMA